MELPRTQYSQEFREHSVKFFKENGLTRLNIRERRSLASWLELYHFDGQFFLFHEVGKVSIFERGL